MGTSDYFVIGILFLGGAIALLIVVPKLQVRRVEKLEDRIALETEIRKTLAQILGGIILLAGLFFTWGQLQTTQENLRVSQEGQITERFTRAIEQLGNKENLEVRLGGIYALERIAKDSKKDHWQIMEVLTAYVRENSPWKDESMQTEAKKEKPSADIQAVLTVLGRRALTYQKGEDYPLDLNRTDMIGANLEEANLNGANFLYANLTSAKLRRAKLEGANLSKANLSAADLRAANLRGAKLSVYSFESADLEGAHFEGAEGLYNKRKLAKTKSWVLAFYDAKQLESLGLPSDHNERVRNKDLRNYHLQDADLSNAELQKAELQKANLRGANLWGANLQEANLRDANLERAKLWFINLQQANLRGASLQEASLIGANLQDANFQDVNLARANLSVVDLRGGKNLTIEQLSIAKTLYRAKLDAIFMEQLNN